VTAVAATDNHPLLSPLREHGHVFVPGASMRHLLETNGTLTDWPTFAQSWERMPVDGYMADGGRYRRRRHAVYAVTRDDIRRQPHQPHYQSRDYNPLHGGIERWFEPIEDSVAEGDSFKALLRLCAGTFGALSPRAPRWHVEAHQFRIEARADAPGNPTPEGLHRDGVDYVLVLLVRRHNVASGVTSIHSPDGSNLGTFTLAQPCDASLLDDTRVFHGVTAVEPLDPAQPAFRDVLVVTFRAEPPPR